MSSVSSARSNGSSSRLIGWLVSYAQDAKGKAFEIRAGRSLISADKIGNNKLVLVSHPSISSPHAALSASPRHRLMLQDVFSEHGTFLTRSNAEKEVPVNGPIEVEHGDWLRIGSETRFQVCMIDGPSR